MNNYLLLLFNFVILFMFYCQYIKYYTVLNIHNEKLMPNNLNENEALTKTHQKQSLHKHCKKTTISQDEIIRLNSHQFPEIHAKNFNASDICQENNADKCVGSFKKIESDYEYIWAIEKANTVLCTIPKDMSILMIGIACFFNDELGFLYNGKNFFGDFYSLECSNKRFKTIEQAETHFNSSAINDLAYLTVVRDPVDRFLSGFIFSCLKGVDYETNCTRYCFGCGANLTCFMEHQYESFMRLSSGKQKSVDFLEHHLYPQNWRCDFKNKLQNYTMLRYDSDSNKIIPKVVEFFQKRNISELALNYIKKTMLQERTHHSTINGGYRDFFEKRLRSSPYLMKLLVRMYYHDFKLFNYSFPEL